MEKGKKKWEKFRNDLDIFLLFTISALFSFSLWFACIFVCLSHFCCDI